MQNYSTQSFFGQAISRFSTPLFLAAALAILAGCGSGQSIPTVPVVATAATGTPKAASIQLLASNTQIPSSGATQVDLTAMVLDANKQAVAGKTVTFSTGTDPSATTNNYTPDTRVSDVNGLVKAKLNLGNDKTNRTINVTATADAAQAMTAVDVTGTTVTSSGSNSMALLATTVLTFSVKDSAGNPLPNIKVAAASKSGNPISLTPATGISNNTGQVTALVTGNVAGSDTITATAAGASVSQALVVSGASFNFIAPTLPAGATSIDIPLNTATPVAINWKDAAGASVSGSAVNFFASRGVIVGSPTTTNATGNTPAAGITVSSASAGPAIITASGAGGTPAATLEVIFVARTATTVTTQAVPGVVQVTTGSTSQTTNSSTISVLVRDNNNNLVKDANVSFKITNDPSGGTLTAAAAKTDVNGSASVTYKAGNSSSGSGTTTGVTIQATVTDINGLSTASEFPAGPVSSSVNLVVSGQALVVRLGTDNLVVDNQPATTYTKNYTAFVSDASGNAVKDVTVRFTLRPGAFQKGFYYFDTVNNLWIKDRRAPGWVITCPNEDTNFNGIIEAGEDTNGNGRLDPSGAATVNASAVTDANGRATAVIVYNKDHATWAEVILEARTGVVGNDPPTTEVFYLPGMASDYNDGSKSPPGPVSPYGAASSTAVPAGNGAPAGNALTACTNTN